MSPERWTAPLSEWARYNSGTNLSRRRSTRIVAPLCSRASRASPQRPPPVFPLHVPGNRFGKPRVHGLEGRPAELELGTARIDCIAVVMPRPVGDERNQLCIGPPTSQRPEVIEGFANPS